jgi:hypothetical protein
MVRLPDGRLRSIPRSITDLAREPFSQGRDSIEESCRVSVRTLLPLASFLARLHQLAPILAIFGVWESGRLLNSLGRMSENRL